MPRTARKMLFPLTRRKCIVSRYNYTGKLLFTRRGRLRTGVVTTLGADHHFPVPFGFGIYTDLAESAGAFGIGRFIPDGVLIANVVGDIFADLIHFIEGLGEECDAASAVGEDLQCFLGTLGMLFVAEDSDRVDRRPILLLQLLDRLLEGFAAGVVFAVGHDEDHFLLQPGILLQVIGGSNDSVVESGPTAGVDF